MLLYTCNSISYFFAGAPPPRIPVANLIVEKSAQMSKAKKYKSKFLHSVQVNYLLTLFKGYPIELPITLCVADKNMMFIFNVFKDYAMICNDILN